MHRIVLLALAVASLAGCVTSEPPAAAPSPDYSFDSVAPTQATGLEYVARLRYDDGVSVDSGGGIFVYGDYVLGSGRNTGWWLADVSEPEHPRVVFHDADGITPYTRDVDVIEHPDGRLTAVFATQHHGMHFWDITDIEQPTWLSAVDVHLNHNLAVVPGTEYVFNSIHRGEGRPNELVDARDPANPVVIGTYGDYGCHHQHFWVDPATHQVALGACAGVQNAEIWDMRGFDPEAPDFGMRTLAVIEGGSAESPLLGNPAFSRHPVDEWFHSTYISPDGKTLIAGSELNGAGSPGGCLVYDEVTGLSTPLGALWFYDITDPSDPQLRSWLSPDHPDSILEPPILSGYDPVAYLTGDGDGCTSHFGEFLEDEPTKMTVGWYLVGTVLIDFSDVSSPRILDHYQAHTTSYSDHQYTWDAWPVGGYVFTGDIERGMDVLRLT